MSQEAQVKEATEAAILGQIVNIDGEVFERKAKRRKLLHLKPGAELFTDD